VHDASIAPEAIMRDVDTVINQLREQPVPQSELDRIRTRLRSGLYDMVGSSTRFSLMDLLASFALFDDNPAKVNTIEQGFAAVTPQLIQETARKYLAPTKRTVLVLEPGAAAPAAKGEAK